LLTGLFWLIYLKSWAYQMKSRNLVMMNCPWKNCLRLAIQIIKITKPSKGMKIMTFVIGRQRMLQIPWPDARD
jgi:hypothetical protein